MDARLYTLHTKGSDEDLRAIPDQRRFGLIPFAWALWQGCWITALGMILLSGAAAALAPGAFGVVWVAQVLIVTFEGDSLIRAELRLRGWREVGVVEARSPDGAVELYLKGEVA